MNEGYVELHCHTCFSMLDGASTPEALLDRAAELGMPALAITDHNGLYGIVRFALAAKVRGLKAITGAELTLDDDSHLLLLAEDETGYRNLCRLISRGQLLGQKNQPRLPLAALAGHTRGLMALTACKQGWAARHLSAGESGKAAVYLETLKELFGPQGVYVELQQHLHRGDGALAAELAHLARRVRLPIVATNDVHYAQREASCVHDVLTAIRHCLPLAQARRHLRSNSEYYLKPAAEMAALFADHPEAIRNTTEVAARCRALDLYFRAEALCPPDETLEQSADERLAELCRAGLGLRYPADPAPAEAQLRHELEVIRQTGMAGYFLMVWDIVHYAKERGIQVRGRGSAANSIVAYLLGITNVDPLAHRLLFERFLSAEAKVMPDIDLDFCSRRREEVIQYVYQRYGERHVAMVCNYICYCARSAVRDVGKALGLPADAIDKVARSQSKWSADKWEAESLGLPAKTWEQFLHLCAAIQGFPRHLGIHVGGMVITRSPLDEVVPLERATMPNRVVIQWDKDNTEDAGLIKLDLLCLRTLSAIDECLKTIKELHGETIDLDSLPLDDPLVYDQLQRADTVGAFQVESRAQQQALVKVLPRNFADIAVEVALIRPGPLQGGMVHPYIRRRQGLEPVRYDHPLLEGVLDETLGVVVFQEQVMKVAMAMGRFSSGEADMLRRAMSRHRSDEEMAAFRKRFVAGAVEQGVPEALAHEVFGKLAGFASYGFCKSHAVAFAKTAYDTLWLRARYPAEYYCSLLNNQPMGYYSPRVLIGDARRHGVRVLGVHVDRSASPCTIEDGGIRLGLLYVDGLGEVGADRVVEARPAAGYADLSDLCRRTRLPRRLVENIILAGGMDHWGGDRRRLIWDLGRLHYGEEELPLPPLPDEVMLEPMDWGEALQHEYLVTGVSANGHIIELFRAQLKATAGVITSSELQRARKGRQVRIAGLVAVRQAPPTARGYVFITLEDETGLANLVLTPTVADRHRWALDKPLLIAEGLVGREGNGVNLKVGRLATVGWGAGVAA
ncbi:MAG: DNA polymerase III subunit alpha [Anaerolineae bacterium]